MTPLRIITVDDEVLALRRLKLLLQTIPRAEHVGEASSCSEALLKIASLKPDAVLLDIKMRDGSGFDIIQALSQRPKPPAIILVTAFDQFAVRAFENAVSDYLLKPVERDRLVQALNRVEQQLKSVDSEQRVDELQQIVRNLRAARREDGDAPFESEFWLRTAGGQVRVSVDEIDCVSSEDEYVAIHTHSGSYLLRSSIRQFVDRIEPGLFVRIHRRWLVKRTSIAELCTRRLGRTEIVLRNGRRIPAGRVYLKQLRQTVHGGAAQRDPAKVSFDQPADEDRSREKIA
jgi:DNA-binding LytR/AlgR family response regulator